MWLTATVCRYPNIPYPAFPAYRERISTEVQQKLTDLARHPAIVLWFGGNEDQCSHYNPARHDGIACAGKNWYPNCQQVYEDCRSIYIDTVLATAANCSSVPLWPVSPAAGWASGVDMATGVPNGQRLVEIEDAQTTPTRPNQGALDMHGPYGSPMQPSTLFHGEGHVLFHSEFGELSLPQYETMAEVLSGSELSVKSGAMAQRSPNGAGARVVGFISGTFGPIFSDYDSSTEQTYRRVAYLTQLAQSEGLRSIVDGGRLGVAAGDSDGTATALERPWGYMCKRVLCLSCRFTSR